MPRNRKHIPREQRDAELLSAATEVFMAEGYVGTTISRISEAAGVARANLYWYYKSKDDIFAAVMNEMLENEIAKLARRCSPDAYTRLTTGLKEMFPFRSLHREMHERIPYSDAVREAHDTFMTWIRELVYEAVDEADAQIDKELLADVIVSLFEGSHTLPADRPANEMVPYVLDSIIGKHAGSRQRY